jgi:hypothetical protein
MTPFRRRKRNRRDMIVLGGWLFADLLLGLAMVFLVANTVGSPPPTPTPTATPDELATAEASFAAQQAANDATREALQGDVAMLEATTLAQENRAASQRLAATQTAEAQATEAAMSEAELATRDAQATQDAVIAQATISAFSTEAASSDANQAALNADLATMSAEATSVAQQVDAQATRQAEIAAVATEQASSGANTQATIAALEDENAANATTLATTEAENAALAQANQSNADALATAEANQAALQEQQAALQATATAFVAVAAPGSLSPNSVEETIQVDLGGILTGDQQAIQQAEDEIRETFQPYVDAADCRAGFVLTSSRSPDLGSGVQLSNAVNDLLQETVPEVFGETAFEGIALPGTAPTGEVILQIFLFSGCSITEGEGG